MLNFIKRLSSRKFLLALAGFLSVLFGSLSPDQQTAIVGLISTFIGAEGFGDAVQRYQAGKTAQAKVFSTPGQEDFDLSSGGEPDKSRLTAGPSNEESGL